MTESTVPFEQNVPLVTMLVEARIGMFGDRVLAMYSVIDASSNIHDCVL